MSVVPACPQGLTVRREDFLLEPFSVDAFLTHWNTSAATSPGATGRPRNLETLRDDLGIYLKVLRSAMIELINEDYADFVNLSTNLVGLDKTLLQLETPLTGYKAQIVEVSRGLEETLAAVNNKLKKREKLYARKIALQNLEHITHTVVKIERLLGLSQGGSASANEAGELSGDLVERVATEINHLNFCVSQCEASTFVAELQPRLKVIGDKLRGALESQLLDSIATQNVEVLKRCLRIFATVDQIKDAEQLVREKIARPFLEEILNESSYHEDPLGLKGVLQKVLKVLPQRLGVLLQLTSDKKQHGKKGSEVKDFNFLVNSVWPEITEQIDDNLSFVFSAGNPEKFYTQYQTSISFMADFESELSNSKAINQFRAHPAHVAFLDRWNLPVYFQIRFQEIALPVETALGNLFDPVKEQQVSRFRLAATEVSLGAAKKCWDSGIFLDSLSHRFLKLCLQVVSRYCKAVEMGPDMMMEVTPSQQPVDMHKSATAMGLKDMEPHRKGHRRNASDGGGGGDHDHELVQEVVLEPYRKRPQDLITLWLDVSDLTKAVSEDLLRDCIMPRLGELAPDQSEAISESFTESCDKLTAQLPSLSTIIVSHTADKCLPFLKQVSDIPRLYRRTNKDVPSKPCSYLTALLNPISAFHKEQASHSCPEEVTRTWLTSVFEQVTEKFLGNVSEVLAAVQKMEESLRRLKRVRDSKTMLAGGGGEDGKAAIAVSDDDKIRLQIYLDVQFYLEKMRLDFGIGKEEVGKAVELDELVNEATKNLEAVRPKV